MIFAGRRYTFGQVQAVVESWCKTFQGMRVPHGSRLAILISNCPAFSIAYFAALWSGAIVVPVNPLLSDQEIIELLLDCDANLLCFEQAYAERVTRIRTEIGNLEAVGIDADPLQNVGASPLRANGNRGTDVSTSGQECSDQTAVILYTSGTTGRPKGVELTHRNLYTNARSVSQEKFSTPDQVNILGPGHAGLAALPLSHAFGQTNLQNGLWFAGATIVYQRKFDAQTALELMADQKVTFFAGVPTMILELIKVMESTEHLKLAAAGKLPSQKQFSLKYCVCGGAALAEPVKRRFRELWGVGLQESYGLSETSPMISCQRIDRTDKAGSVGQPISGVEVRLLDDHNRLLGSGGLKKPQRGEIVVRGPNVFQGYFRDREQTKRVFIDGWFRTGDIGEWDADGDLRIVDRQKEIIKKGGYTIYPREIENVLLDIERVLEAVVVGVPDEKYGEEIKAFVTLNAGLDSRQFHDKTDPKTASVIAEIKSACKKKLASYKRPQIVEVLDEMPTGSTGKIDRKQLRNLVS